MIERVAVIVSEKRWPCDPQPPMSNQATPSISVVGPREFLRYFFDPWSRSLQPAQRHLRQDPPHPVQQQGQSGFQSHGVAFCWPFSLRAGSRWWDFYSYYAARSELPQRLLILHDLPLAGWVPHRRREQRPGSIV